jgi:CheY-like chemotaxis protein
MDSDRVGILVVAEGISRRKELKGCLEACGFTVSEACGIADGLQTVCDGFRPRIIVTDMDEGDIHRFRSDAAKRGVDGIRIISLTVLESLAGIDGAFAKPWHYLYFGNAMRSAGSGVGPMGAPRR